MACLKLARSPISWSALITASIANPSKSGAIQAAACRTAPRAARLTILARSPLLTDKGSFAAAGGSFFTIDADSVLGLDENTGGTCRHQWRPAKRGATGTQKIEYRGYDIRYQFTGAGWFAHYQPIGYPQPAKESHVTATPREGEGTLLERARAAIDALLG